MSASVLSLSIFSFTLLSPPQKSGSILFSFTFKNKIKKEEENQNKTIEGEIVDKKKDEL